MLPVVYSVNKRDNNGIIGQYNIILKNSRKISGSSFGSIIEIFSEKYNYMIDSKQNIYYSYLIRANLNYLNF